MVIGAVALIAATLGPAAARAQTSPPATRVTIYPILARVPIFGASIDLPSVPGDGGGAASGTTDLSLNAAYMAGLLVESPRWMAEVNGLWAALSAHHSLPHVLVDSDTYFFAGRAGVRVAGGVSATGGFRRVTMGLHASLDVAAPVSTLEASAKPGFWDPMIGVDWRRSVGSSWVFDANLQGGGFGVGTDIDVSSDMHARWRPASHFELRTGFTIVHFKLTVADVTVGPLQRTLVVRQSLYGPEIGFGIVF